MSGLLHLTLARCFKRYNLPAFNIFLMAKITYLFGAGASANTIPIVTQMPARLYYFRKVLTKGDGLTPEFAKLRDTIVIMIGKILDQLIDLDAYEQSNQQVLVLKHASIDTLAKKFFIQGSVQELDNLKVVLTLFLMFEQETKGIDIRYDSFFASIIRDSSRRLPASINIISWNYDTQFEYAFDRFLREGVQSASRALGIKVKGSSYLPTTQRENGFGVFKINGAAMLLDKNQIHKHYERDSESVCDYVCRTFRAIDQRHAYNALSFSWERDENRILEVAVAAVQSTEVLVLIGYSIPFFNREVDRKIVNEMALRKVYIQDLNPEGVKERFLAVRSQSANVDIILRHDVDQFYLPDELTL